MARFVLSRWCRPWLRSQQSLITVLRPYRDLTIARARDLLIGDAHEEQST